MNNNGAPTGAITFPNRLAKLFGRGNLVPRWKHRLLSCEKLDLCGQLCTSLATTCGYDRAAGTSAHTDTKAVLARAATVVRLERPLALGHGDTPSSGITGSIEF